MPSLKRPPKLKQDQPEADAAETAATPAAAAAGASPAGTPATGHIVTVAELNAYYGKQHALKDVNVVFPAGEVTALIGPSGSGKSTVVRCVNRMHEEIPGARAEGIVKLDNTDLYGPDVDLTAVRRVIGMVFQKPNPFPTMSIFDNVAAGLRLTGTKVADIKDRVESSLRSVGLWDEVKDRLPKPGIGLSGGQQQRLCIARTIAVEPGVVLMDEPCSALDPVATLKVEQLIQELKSRFTIVIVTHNMQQAVRVSNSTVFMLDGELVEHAPTDTLFNDPADDRTARYVSGQFG
jgi:phosphate transport system ATP-binding protein